MADTQAARKYLLGAYNAAESLLGIVYDKVEAYLDEVDERLAAASGSEEDTPESFGVSEDVHIPSEVEPTTEQKAAVIAAKHPNALVREVAAAGFNGQGNPVLEKLWKLGIDARYQELDLTSNTFEVEEVSSNNWAEVADQPYITYRDGHLT